MSYAKANELKPGIWQLVLNRPEKMNVLSGEMVADLIREFSQLKIKANSSELRVLILSSASEKAFCAGADLSERIKMNEVQVGQALDQLRILTEAVEAFPVPTIAVINGIAFGGGLELALACDMRVAASTAQMGLSETKLAIIPGAGGTQRLTQIVGVALAKEWIFTAKKISATEARDAGLVNYCNDKPHEKALELAEEIAKAGPVAIRAAKKAIAGGQGLNMSAALDWERKCYNETISTSDRIEGLAAFQEKRSPQYQGK